MKARAAGDRGGDRDKIFLRDRSPNQTPNGPSVCNRTQVRVRGGSRWFGSLHNRDNVISNVQSSRKPTRKQDFAIRTGSLRAALGDKHTSCGTEVRIIEV